MRTLTPPIAGRTVVTACRGAGHRGCRRWLFTPPILPGCLFSRASS